LRIARVFPRKTKATPTDELAFVGMPTLTLDADEIHISVAFTFDIPEAERLAYQWQKFGLPVRIDGPAFNHPGGEFTPGMYLKPGYVITSRGCPNHCWFCEVPKREGALRELEVKPGWNVLDDNLLACSQGHILSVFRMLGEQKQKPLFTGGLEAARLKPWHAKLLYAVKAERMYFAYDTPNDYEPLVEAGKTLRAEGFTTNTTHWKTYAYVLIGYKGDTFEKAEKRLLQTLDAGFMPYAMLYKDKDGYEDETWAKFRGQWIRPTIIILNNREFFGEGENDIT
jgi:hypothetical protein